MLIAEVIRNEIFQSFANRLHHHLLPQSVRVCCGHNFQCKLLHLVRLRMRSSDASVIQGLLLTYKFIIRWWMVVEVVAKGFYLVPLIILFSRISVQYHRVAYSSTAERPMEESFSGVGG